MLNEEQEQEHLIPNKKRIVKLSTINDPEPEYFDVERAMVIQFQRRIVANPFYMFGIVLLAVLLIIGMLHASGN
jgi:hypothetical protein